jgi:hypothetical protein
MEPGHGRIGQPDHAAIPRLGGGPATHLSGNHGSYPETMAAWRSTCPRLSVWEDAIIDGLARIDNDNGRAIVLTARGRKILRNGAAAPAS